MTTNFYDNQLIAGLVLFAVGSLLLLACVILAIYIVIRLRNKQPRSRTKTRKAELARRLQQYHGTPHEVIDGYSPVGDQQRRHNSNDSATTIDVNRQYRPTPVGAHGATNGSEWVFKAPEISRASSPLSNSGGLQSTDLSLTISSRGSMGHLVRSNYSDLAEMSDIQF